MKYLKLIRFQNLLLVAIMQLILRYGFLKLQNIETALADWQYALLVLSTVLIAAGGYVINDIFDQETDAINKPNEVIIGKSISETAAYNIYVGLTILGVAIGFYLSNLIFRSGFAVFFILIATLLYYYATTLKQMPIIGNFIVALLLSFSVIIVWVFDVFPATADDNRQTMMLMFSIIKDYAIFAFIINFAREIIKDLQDLEGDKFEQMKTLPILIGVHWTTKIVALLLAIATALLLHYTIANLLNSNLYYATLYAFVFVIAPIIYSLITIFFATTKPQFAQVSTVLKWVIFFGILSITIIRLNINYNG